VVNQPLSFVVEPNPDYVNSRTASLSITLGWAPSVDFVETLTIVQKAKEIELDVTDKNGVSTNSLSFAATASGSLGFKTIFVETNEPWTIAYIGGDVPDGYFSFSATTGGNAIQWTSSEISIYPTSTNSTAAKLEAEYEITCGNKTWLITVTQKAPAPVLETLNLAGTAAVPQTTTSTVPAGYTIDPASLPSWVTPATTTINASGTITVGVADNTWTDGGTGADIPRSGSIMILDGLGEDAYEVIVNQDRRWWLGVSNVTGYNTGSPPKPPIPNLDFMAITNNANDRPLIDAYIQPFVGGKSIPDQLAPPYNPREVQTITLNFNGITSIISPTPPTQTVTLEGWIGGQAVTITRPTTWYSGDPGLFYSAGTNGSVNTATVNSNVTVGDLSTITVTVGPTSNTLNFRRYFLTYLSLTDTSLSNFRYYIYLMQVW